MCYGKSSYELRFLPNLLSSQVAACSLEVVAYYFGCSSSHSSNYSDYSDYLSPTLALILMLVLVPVLIGITSILSLMLLILLILLIHIPCLLYYHLPRLTIHSAVLSSTRLADLRGVILNGIHHTLLFL